MKDQDLMKDELWKPLREGAPCVSTEFAAQAARAFNAAVEAWLSCESDYATLKDEFISISKPIDQAQLKEVWAEQVEIRLHARRTAVALEQAQARASVCLEAAHYHELLPPVGGDDPRMVREDALRRRLEGKRPRGLYPHND